MLNFHLNLSNKDTSLVFHATLQSLPLHNLHIHMAFIKMNGFQMFFIDKHIHRNQPMNHKSDFKKTSNGKYSSWNV